MKELIYSLLKAQKRRGKESESNSVRKWECETARVRVCERVWM